MSKKSIKFFKYCYLHKNQSVILFFFKKIISKQALNLLHQLNQRLGVANENKSSKRNKSCIGRIDDVDSDVYQLKYLS